MTYLDYGNIYLKFCCKYYNQLIGMMCYEHSKMHRNSKYDYEWPMRILYQSSNSVSSFFSLLNFIDMLCFGMGYIEF